MKILGLADLHNCPDHIEDLCSVDVDLVVVCGDLHDAGYSTKVEPVLEALSKVPAPKVVVPGNTDTRSITDELWPSFGLINIHGRSYRARDCGFIGIGGMVLRRPPRASDSTRFYHNDEDVIDVLTGIYPEISDCRYRVVVTHQPPRDHQDLIYNGERTGCQSLLKFLKINQPNLLLCGHIHEDSGMSKIKGTYIVNVGEARRGYGALIRLENGDVGVEWLRF